MQPPILTHAHPAPRSFHIRPMRPEDYDAVTAVWRRCTGVVLSSADRLESFASYLERNPGLSLLAEDSGTGVGALLCGHDGRRGYLHHLGVDPEHRGRGIGRRLVAEAVGGLRGEGIVKAHIFVLHDQPASLAFWAHIGWRARGDIGVVSLDLALNRCDSGAMPEYNILCATLSSTPANCVFRFTPFRLPAIMPHHIRSAGFGTAGTL